MREMSTLVILISLLLLGCQSEQMNSRTADRSVSRLQEISRDPASSDELEQEVSFQALMSEADSHVKLKTNYLERLLHIHYRAEFYVSKFEEHLDGILARKEKTRVNPLDSDPYRHLMQMWLISSRTTHDMEYIYKRLHETSRSESATQASRQRAAEILLETHKWLDSLPEEDRLQLIELYERLNQVRKAADQASALTNGQPQRETASTFGDLAYLEPSELEARFKKLAPVIKKKAKDSLKWHDAEADSDPKWMSVEVDRAPDSPVIFPSTGPEGNTYGKQFKDGTFTFSYDDGPAEKSTLRLHGVLSKYADPLNPKGVPATFFCLVQNVLRFPQVVQATKRMGYPMNNHSWTHPLFTKLTADQLQHEVVDSTPVLERAFGYKFRFFRCPYGACYAPAIPLVRKMIADQKLIHAYWMIDSLDWKNIGQPQRTADLVIKQIQIVKKGVILMHDIHDSTIDATQLVLNWIKSQNTSAHPKLKIRLMNLEDAVDEVNGVKK